MSTQPNKAFINLTPIERARLKIIIMLALTGVFNAVLAVLAYFDQFKVIDWKVLTTSVLAQAALAVLEAVRKYYTASGDAPLATTVGLVETEVAARTPVVKLSPNEQALKDALAQLVAAQTDAANTALQPKAEAGEMPAIKAIASDIPTLNTLPNIAAISQPQQG